MDNGRLSLSKYYLTQKKKLNITLLKIKSISVSEEDYNAQGCAPIRATITGQRVMAELPKSKNMLNLSSQTK